MTDLLQNRLTLVLLATVFVFACTKQDSPTGASVATDPQQTLIEQGRKTYIAHCISCHNINPRQDGALGPALAGSSLELLNVKVLTGEYPPGYKPRRETKAMAPLPMLKDKIEALHAFLQQ